MSHKSTDFYNQCTLKRPNEEVYEVSWIPEEFAFPNKLIAVKNSGGDWENWIVKNVGTKQSAKYIEDHRDDYRKQRKTSDI